MSENHLSAPTRFAYRLWKRRHQRVDQDPPSSAAVAQAQTEVHRAYLTPMAGDKPYAYLNKITQPTLVLNGINDLMIATVNSFYPAQNIPNAQTDHLSRRGPRCSVSVSAEVSQARDPVPGRVI